MASLFDIKGVYSFDVYPSAILGTSFQNVTILSIMDYESALNFGDIASLHINVFPYLPEGSPDDPTATDYVRIRTSSGAATILGVNWINPATIEQVTSQRAIATIEGVTNSDVPRILNALVQNGFNQVEVKLA